MGRPTIQMFERAFERTTRGLYQMKRDHLHPISIRNTVNLETMTVRELGELAEMNGMKLLDILTL